MAESNLTYERRDGTDCDHGIKFEWQTTNLAYLRCEKLHRQWVQDNTSGVKSYFVANNVDGIGAFDDVVIRVEYPHQNEYKTKLIFVQCKHYKNPKKYSLEKMLSPELAKTYFDSFIAVLRVLKDHRALSRQTYKEIEICKKARIQRTQEMERNTEKEQKIRNLFQSKPQDCEFILYSNMILDAGFENTQIQQDNEISMKILNTARSNEFNILLNAAQLEFLPNEQFFDARKIFEELKQEFATKFRIIVNQADNINVDLLKSIIPAADIREIYPLLEEEVKCNFQNIPSTAITENSELLENIENFCKLKTAAKNEMEKFLRISEHGNLFSNESIDNLQKQFKSEAQTKIFTSCIELEKLKLKQFVTDGFLESKLLVFIKDEIDFSIWTKARKSKLYMKLNQIIVCIDESNKFSGYDKESNEVFIEINYDSDIKNSACFAQFSDETSKFILNYAITFQGFAVTINDICGDEWCRLLDEETICRILNREEIKIGSKFVDHHDCYVERKLQFKINKHRNDDDDDCYIEKRLQFIVITDENCWQVNQRKIRYKSGKTDPKTLTEDDIISIENKKIFLPSGPAGIDNSFTSCITYPIPLTEDDIIAIENKKIFLLSGPAGIGKSSTLKSLALKYKIKNPSHFVHFVELNKYLNVLKKFKEDSNVSVAIDFLAKNILSLQPLEYQLFYHACEEKKNVALFFDAFDEISPDGEQKFSSYLETLLKAHVSCIFVSSRPYFINTLEKNLNKNSLIFVPFTFDDKKLFFLQYYEKLTKQNATTNDKEEMENVISTIIKFMEEEKFNEILEIPLQISMLAEIHFDKISEMTKEEKMSFSFNMDICSLYNAFIEKLVVRFLVEKKKLNLQNMQDAQRNIEIKNTMRDAEELACKLICPDINQTPISEYSDAIVKMCNQVGLITNIDPPVFLHRTYGEFLAANWFVQCILNKKQNTSYYVSFLCKNILCKDEYCEITKFINAILCNLNSEENDSHIINPDVKILFLPQLSGETSLHVAARENHTEILKLLVNNNNDPSMINKLIYFGCTAADIACDYNNIEALQYLLPRTDSTLILKGERNRSLLHIAARRDNLIITNLIMEKFPQLLNQKDSDGCTALHYACINTDVVKLLLSHDNCQINVHNDKQENPLHYASKRSNLEVMKMLLERDISLLNIRNENGQTPLHLTLNKLDDVVKYYYFPRKKIDENDCIAASKCLLNLNCSVNVKDLDKKTPLHLASMRWYVEIIKLLLERDETLLNQQDKDGRTPLHCVFEDVKKESYGTTRYEAMSCLLNFPECDINLTDNGGNTPLHLAARRWYARVDDDDKIFPLFIQRDGLQLNVQNDMGETALHLAARYCNSEEIKVLLSHKESKVNTQDKNGDTPLHSCIQGWMNGEQIVIDLIKHDSSILNIKNNKGQTPLLEAVKWHEFKVVDLLVQLGADVNIKNNDNRTPLELARWLAADMKNNYNCNTTKLEGEGRLNADRRYDYDKRKNRKIIETLCPQSAGTATTEPPSGVEEIE